MPCKLILIEKHTNIKATRSCKCSATLPKVSIEYSQQRIFYMVAKVSNNLPIYVKTAKYGKGFKEKLDSFLKIE